MRDQLFQYYVEFGDELCYLRNYSMSARRISNVYSGFLMLVSAGGIVSLSYWTKYPVIWALVTVAAQVLQTLKPLMQSSKQRQALTYIIQDANVLFDELSLYWNTVGAYDPPLEDDEKIAARILSIKQRYRQSLERFAANLDFPKKNRLKNKAKIENSRYFWYHYGVKIKEEY